MKKIALLLMLLGCNCSLHSFATNPYEFSNECKVAGVGAQGTILVRALGTSKKLPDAKRDAMRNAVYATLFKGFANTEVTLSTDLRPMIEDENVYYENKEFFESFFADNGRYLDFVSFIDQMGEVGPGDVVKQKRMYNVKMVVSVKKDALRKEMEKLGYVQKFGI